ncbi:MAG: cupin domain-containing protein [Lentimicrobiaceae bacterium]|nr:cupin domain-containing protein [Lentimicrobiaceae bacterium]MCB9023529.1 cupin domain-containing protein [Lentimicrobiaceae bacterium]MCO5266598.1 cupin domain-containing protein [Lentimicrobium sp.]HPG33801.1 cupin domain-containing protein [Lentimicrobium sp.]
MKPSSYFVEHLGLQRHPEGGWYKEVYRSPFILAKQAINDSFSGDRNLSTSIYFLLEGDDFSAFHRIKSDEIWNFHAGSSLVIYWIDLNGLIQMRRLGEELHSGDSPQVVVPAGCWFAAKPISPDTYCLVGCSVAPGFDFADFEMAKRNLLLREYPEHKDMIFEFTRD